ncbi:GntR family transcriptional regulator [Paenibacillus sp. SC116]|uniref:GntR family transcriptional regulator n=1 Tax=Paenibacillus sp. SC116 TaxID=2968986 RepID=UPI00215B012E|nr:GntR family transcriptional regulator [Paenibacillus sp. SC116]MCR8845217.1 GntR family transcriptional regulator [Paenibacillus sp. SC116]
MIQLQQRGSSPIYEQIVEQMKELIAKDVLKAGDKVPSVRELSSTLLINPNTVSKAYQELERQGVIQTIRGKGTFVLEPSAPRMAAERIEVLRQELQRLTVEAKHLGITKAQFREMVDDASHMLGEGYHAAD